MSQTKQTNYSKLTGFGIFAFLTALVVVCSVYLYATLPEEIQITETVEQTAQIEDKTETIEDKMGEAVAEEIDVKEEATMAEVFSEIQEFKGRLLSALGPDNEPVTILVSNPLPLDNEGAVFYETYFLDLNWADNWKQINNLIDQEVIVKAVEHKKADRDVLIVYKVTGVQK